MDAAERRIGLGADTVGVGHHRAGWPSLLVLVSAGLGEVPGSTRVYPDDSVLGPRSPSIAWET
jgi:hypothetical protein